MSTFKVYPAGINLSSPDLPSVRHLEDAAKRWFTENGCDAESISCYITQGAKVIGFRASVKEMR